MYTYYPSCTHFIQTYFWIIWTIREQRQQSLWAKTSAVIMLTINNNSSSSAGIV